MNALPPVSAGLMSERRVSLIGAVVVALGPVSMAMFTPAMPEIVRAFGTTESAVKMALSFYFAGFALAQLVCGPLSDGLGRKPILSAFILIYLAASLVALVAPNIETLVAARFVQGVGASAGFAISRAVVRDLFSNERAARIMNLIGIILAIGPALAPTIGGLTLEAAGWHAIFAVMVLLGLAALAATRFGLRETVPRDLSRIRPNALLLSYRTLLGNGYFMGSSLAVAGTIGALYALATILPFVLMNRLGLTPTQFGFAMLIQSGSFFVGSLIVRPLMARIGSVRLVPYGLACVGLGGAMLAVGLRITEPGFLGVMIPVGLFAFGIAFVMPALTVAALTPFPRIAGSASSLTGFLQMGGGLAGGTVSAMIGDPVVALSTVIPAMALIAILSWFYWRSLPEPQVVYVAPKREEPPVGPL